MKKEQDPPTGPPQWWPMLAPRRSGHSVVTSTEHDAGAGSDSCSLERKDSAVRPRAALRMGCFQHGRGKSLCLDSSFRSHLLCTLHPQDTGFAGDAARLRSTPTVPSRAFTCRVPACTERVGKHLITLCASVDVVQTWAKLIQDGGSRQCLPCGLLLGEAEGDSKAQPRW